MIYLCLDVYQKIRNTNANVCICKCYYDKIGKSLSYPDVCNQMKRIENSLGFHKPSETLGDKVAKV